jgi:hypothetical protein
MKEDGTCGLAAAMHRTKKKAIRTAKIEQKKMKKRKTDSK